MKKILLCIVIIYFVYNLGAVNRTIINWGNVLQTIAGEKMATRTIDFSGITWLVRNGTGNPGGNNWSDSSESVWVDNEGTLHLKIRNVSGKWYCSEIYSEKTVGYGQYIFNVASNVEKLNKNVVVGLFTYLNDKNEIDIEFSKWGNATEKNMGHYVTQPSKTTGNKHDFNLNLSGNYSTHRFIWEPTYINFKSWQTNDTDSVKNTIIEDWNYYGNDIPVPGEERLILNLWLYKGIAPDDGKEVEVLVNSIKMNKLLSVSDLDIVIKEDTAILSILGNLISPGFNSNELTYSVIDGNENGMFSVSNNGEIILEKPLNYENSSLEKLSVLVLKGELTDTALVNIRITNVIELGMQNASSYFYAEVYPNPASNQLNIHFKNNESIEIQVLSSDGKMFSVNEISRSDDKVILDISGLKSGDYLVYIKEQTKTEILKFSKVHIN